MAEEINNKETSKHIEKGSIIYQQGNSVQSICVILKGRVLIQNESIRSVVGTGSFLGVYDAYKGTYQSTYTAIDNLVVVQAQVQSAQDIPGICERYNGYGGLLTSYLSRRHVQQFSSSSG